MKIESNVYQVLLTGATGFVGSRLLEHFITLGWSVAVLIRDSSDRSSIDHLIDDHAVYFYDGTISSVEAALVESGCEVVIHVASLFIAEHQSNDVNELIASNVGFPAHILEAMYSCGQKKIINVGTSWQYFDGESYNPACLYAATKQAFEALLEFYIQAHSFSAVTLVLYDTYGPGDERKKLIPTLNKMSESGGELGMSPGDQEIDLVHVDDVVRAFEIAVINILDYSDVDHRKYFIRSGKPVKIKDVVDFFVERSGGVLTVNWGARPYRDREVMSPYRNGRQLPGWSPLIELADGLAAL